MGTFRNKDKGNRKHPILQRERDSRGKPTGNYAYGATVHDGDAVKLKEVIARIRDLYGKSQDSDRKRRIGMPTHIEQIQNFLHSIIQSGLWTKIFEKAINELDKTVKSPGIPDHPHVGFCFGNIVVLVSKIDGIPKCEKQGGPYSESQFIRWKIDGKSIGSAYKQFEEYREWFSKAYQAGTGRSAAGEEDDGSASRVGRYFAQLFEK